MPTHNDTTRTRDRRIVLRYYPHPLDPGYTRLRSRRMRLSRDTVTNKNRESVLPPLERWYPPRSSVRGAACSSASTSTLFAAPSAEYATCCGAGSVVSSVTIFASLNAVSRKLYVVSTVGWFAPVFIPGCPLLKMSIWLYTVPTR